MNQKKHLKAGIHHLIIGLLLTLKGGDKISHHPFIGIFILVMGIFIVSYFLYEVIGKKHSINLKLAVHLFESIALAFTGYVYFSEGKQYLPYLTLIASAVFFIWFIIDAYKIRYLKKPEI